MNTYNSNTASKPFQPQDNFVSLHRALYKLYTRLPDFKADHAMLYVVLMDYWNPAFGYAFPTIWDLAHALNCGENKPNELCKVLEKYKLIKKKRLGDNNIYYVFSPISDEKLFMETYPQAKDYYDERSAKFIERKKHRDGDRNERDRMNKSSTTDSVVPYH